MRVGVQVRYPVDVDQRGTHAASRFVGLRYLSRGEGNDDKFHVYSPSGESVPSSLLSNE